MSEWESKLSEWGRKSSELRNEFGELRSNLSEWNADDADLRRNADEANFFNPTPPDTPDTSCAGQVCVRDRLKRGNNRTGYNVLSLGEAFCF